MHFCPPFATVTLISRGPFAANAVRNVLRVLKRSDTLAPCQEHLIPLDDYYDLVGLKAMLTREENYDKEAAALVQKRAAE